MPKIVDVTFKLIDEMTKPLQKINTELETTQKQWKRAANNINSYSKKISSIGTKMTASLTVPIAGLATYAAKTAADFEQTTSNIAAAMGTTADDSRVKELSKSAKELGATTAFSAQQVNEAYVGLTQSGLTVNEQLAAMPTILNMAAGGEMEIANAANYASTAVLGFGDSFSNMAIYGDQIAKGATMAKTNTELYATAVSSAASSAKSYGQSAIDAEATLLRLANADIKGEEAATAYSQVLSRLYAPSAGAATEALDALGVSAYNADGSSKQLTDVILELQNATSGLTDEQKNFYLKTIFGQEALKSYNRIISTSNEKTDEYKNALSNCSGAAADMAATQLDNLNGQITLLKSGVEGAAIAFGDKLLPHIKRLVTWVQGLVDKINNLSDSQMDTIITVAKWIAIIGPALLVIGKIMGMVSSLINGMLALNKALTACKKGFAIIKAGKGVFNGILTMIGPGGLVLLGILAIAAAAVLIYKNWDKIKPVIDKVLNVFKAFGQKVMGFVQPVIDFFSNIFKENRDNGASVGEAILNTIKTALSTIFSKAGSLFKEWFSSVLKTVGINPDSFFGNISTIFENVKSIAGNVVTIVKQAIDNISEHINTIKTVIQNVITFLTPIVQQIISILQPIMTFISDVFVAGITVQFEIIKSYVVNVINTIVDIFGGLTTVLNGIIEFITGVFTGNWQQAWQGVKDIFTGIVQTIEGVFKGVINGVISVINGAINGINKISFDVPDWVPGLGGSHFGANIPTIPALYEGTKNWQGGEAIINEKAYGGEIVDLPSGTRVYPHDESVQKAYADGATSNNTNSVTIAKLADSIVVREDADIDKIVNALVNKLQKASVNLGGAM